MCTVERREKLSAQGFDSSPRGGGGFLWCQQHIKVCGTGGLMILEGKALLTLMAALKSYFIRD